MRERVTPAPEAVTFRLYDRRLALALLSRRYRPNAVDAPWRGTSARIACTPLPRNTASRPRRPSTAHALDPRSFRDRWSWSCCSVTRALLAADDGPVAVGIPLGTLGGIRY